MSRPFGHKSVEDWVEFVEVGPSKSGKTKIWDVTGKEGSDDHIGQVRWNGAWRKYVFVSNEAYYDWECLRFIADFIERVTLEHKESLK